MTNKFLFVLLLFSINIFAQDPKLSDNFTVEVGEEYGETDGKFKSFFKYNNKVVAINRHKDHLIIQRFDPITLKEVDRIEHEKFFKNKEKHGFEKIMRIGDNVILFYAKWNRKTQIESLEAQIISLDNLKIGKQKEIIRQEGKIAGSFRVTGNSFFITKIGTVDKFSYKTSFDEKTLLIEYRLKPKFRDDSKSYDRISINVFNENLELDWKGQVEMPYTEKKMNNEDYAIDKHGDFYMLASVYEDDSTDEKKKKKEGANYHLELFKVKKNTNTIIKNEIKLGDKFIDEVMLYEDVEGNIVITGTSKNPDKGKSRVFFSTKEKGLATGVFTMKLNENGAVSSFKNYDFPLELLKKYATKKEKKKNKKISKEEDEKPGLRELKINSIVLNNDGSFLILGEQRYTVIRTSYSSTGKQRTTITYYYRDILATKINADGTLAWMQKLPKRQIGKRGQGTMSFTHMFAGNNHYLLYLDNVKNLNLPEDKVPYVHTDGKGGYFTAYIINDKTGEVKKEAIFNTRDFNDTELEHFDTDKILPLSDSEILIEGFEGRNKDFLVKVSAKK
ncbi:hypothetical protein A8C32_12950 [Flavivirga aquatica]|uniref:Uncharacterized protein n=1 Tax=Flavivirga aquatica TaxID=1849968 RepID=A0A1E5TE12_9FLAO|nr:hypothetical protein [Flavivirga aquatica]OEK09605.1 hypothetical protein A8C32_12950 [Flavivirga aquatica]